MQDDALHLINPSGFWFTLSLSSMLACLSIPSSHRLVDCLNTQSRSILEWKPVFLGFWVICLKESVESLSYGPGWVVNSLTGSFLKSLLTPPDYWSLRIYLGWAWYGFSSCCYLVIKDLGWFTNHLPVFVDFAMIFVTFLCTVCIYENSAS